MSWEAQSGQGQAAMPTTAPAVTWGGRDAIIIVPLDGSVEAKVALPVARLISNITGAAVQVIHVTEEPLPRKELLRQLKLSRSEETVGLVINQVTGAPAEQIVGEAGAKGAMLIVMTTRGHTAYQGHALRPVPERVLYEAPCPVLLIRPENGPRVGQLKALHRILLPLDGAPSTMAVVGPAVSLADKSSAELDVLYVAEAYARTALEAGTLTTPRYVDQPQYEWPAWVQECTDRFCAVAGGCPPVAPARVFVRHGEPRGEILSFAAERETDLIVLEWRGRFDPTHAEVVRGVLEQCPCPVLLLRTTPAG